MTLTLSPTCVYDDFAGPELDRTRWRHLELSTRKRSGSWRSQEPNARTEVGDGILDMHVRRFERAHDELQIFDNSKHQLVSTQAFELSSWRSVTFSMEIAATSINATPYDYRDGFAAFKLLGLSCGWSFHIGVSSDRIFAAHEWEQGSTFNRRTCTNVVDLPMREVQVRPGQGHLYEVTLDMSRRAVEWRIDHRLVYDTFSAELPERLKVALGLSTLHPIRDGRSQSLRGQGMSASFGPLAIQRRH